MYMGRKCISDVDTLISGSTLSSYVPTVVPGTVTFDVTGKKLPCEETALENTIILKFIQYY